MRLLPGILRGGIGRAVWEGARSPLSLYETQNSYTWPVSVSRTWIFSKQLPTASPRTVNTYVNSLQIGRWRQRLGAVAVSLAHPGPLLILKHELALSGFTSRLCEPSTSNSTEGLLGVMCMTLEKLTAKPGTNGIVTRSSCCS